MSRFARLNGGTAIEIIECDDIESCFHPDFVAALVAVDETVLQGMALIDGVFCAAKQTIIDPREGMVISKVKAMQNLKKVGKLNLVLDLMDALPRDNDVRILWDFSENLHRTDPTLIDFCISKMGLDDEGIDNLFL